MLARPNSSRPETGMTARFHVRRGGSVVEFAVVASVMFMVILGIIEMARAYMVEHLLTNGARIGARAAIIDGTTTSGVTGVVNSYLTDSGIKGANVTIEVNGDSGVDLEDAEEGDLITVMVSAPVSQNSWIAAPSFLAGNQTATFSLRHE